VALLSDSSARDALAWGQRSAFQRNYQLMDGPRLVATLRFEKTFGANAAATFQGREFRLLRTGILQPRVVVTDADGRAVARFRPNWSGGGVVEWNNGVKFSWKATNFWKSEWGFVDAEKNPHLKFFQQLALFRNGARVSAIRETEYTPVQCLLGWYLLVLAAEESARCDRAS
jgi:hypothetical protein